MKKPSKPKKPVGRPRKVKPKLFLGEHYSGFCGCPIGLPGKSGFSGYSGKPLPPMFVIQEDEPKEGSDWGGFIFLIVVLISLFVLARCIIRYDTQEPAPPAPTPAESVAPEPTPTPTPEPILTPEFAVVTPSPSPTETPPPVADVAPCPTPCPKHHRKCKRH